MNDRDIALENGLLSTDYANHALDGNTWDARVLAALAAARAEGKAEGLEMFQTSASELERKARADEQAQWVEQRYAMAAENAALLAQIKADADGKAAAPLPYPWTTGVVVSKIPAQAVKTPEDAYEDFSKEPLVRLAGVDRASFIAGYETGLLEQYAECVRLIQDHYNDVASDKPAEQYMLGLINSIGILKWHKP